MRGRAASAASPRSRHRSQRSPINWQRIRAEAERFGVTRFRPGQREILESVLSGQDTLGLMPTGSGKSLTYQVPALLLPKPTIVVSPLISLMQDQTEKAEEAEVAAAELNSTLTSAEEREARNAIAEGEHRLIYVTPERLENAEYRDLLREQGVSLFVVDEAHCISQWGHDFRPAYLGLRDAIRSLGDPPVLALTATAPPDVQQDIIQQLGLKHPAVVDTGIDRSNLFLEVFRAVNGSAKRQRISEILRETEGTGIVYLATMRAANELYEWLCDEGVNAARYHGKMKPREREQTQQRFMAGEFKVIVATKAFGLGIDKPDIRFIIHYHFPDSLESYYQEIGRAGRDGKPARCPLLYRLEDRKIQGYFLGGKYPRREHSQKIYDLVATTSNKERTISAADLTQAAGLPQRKVKVILAQLESAGIVQRRAGKMKCARTFPSPEEMSAFLSEYERRHLSDRERLDAMMRYAETTFCRMGVLREYFGEECGKDCGHCDNCRARAEGTLLLEQAPTPAGTSRSSAPKQPTATAPRTPLYEIGGRVKHRRFGTGQVLEISGENLTIDFGHAGQKRIRANYVQKAA